MLNLEVTLENQVGHLIKITQCNTPAGEPIDRHINETKRKSQSNSYTSKRLRTVNFPS